MIRKTRETRKNKRRICRTRYANKCKTTQRPYADSWFEIKKLYDDWILQCDIVTHNLEVCCCCATRNFTYKDYRHQQQRADQPKNAAALSSVLLLDTLEHLRCKCSWTYCNSCSRSKTHKSHVVVHNSSYMQGLLSARPLHLQLLSVIDLSISVTRIANAIACGLLERRSLLDSPLLC